MGVDIVGEGPEIGIVVRDAERMLAFYRDFLGLPVEREMDGTGAHLWWLRCGGGFVKLVQLETVPATANPPDGMLAATGMRFLTIQVSNIDEMVSTVEEGGGRLLWRKAVPAVSMAMLEDPDGNHVELSFWNEDVE